VQKRSRAISSPAGDSVAVGAKHESGRAQCKGDGHVGSRFPRRTVDEVGEDSRARAPKVRRTEPRRWMEPGKRDEAEEDGQSWGRRPLGFRRSTAAELLAHG
jgi:hypothetical protein